MAPLQGLPRLAPFHGLLRLSRNLPWSNLPFSIIPRSHQPPIGPPAARLEAPYNPAQPASQRLADKKDSMQVVRHHLKLKDLDFRMVLRDVPPLIPDSASQLRQLNAGIIAAPIDTAKQRPAPFNRHRHHIDAAAGVIMSCKAAFHRRFLFPCKHFPLLVILSVHAPKITKKKRYRNTNFPKYFLLYNFFNIFPFESASFPKYCLSLQT
ncbi:MAG: hypothetical protein J6W97_04915 [Bacteroidaceae bacterium]|nr:hypothetical protein [Bacteroidaceae bacterium]